MKEVASLTGVSLTTVRGWCSSGALVSVRIGGVVLVKPDDLTAFLDAHREGLAVTPLRHHARRRGLAGSDTASGASRGRD